METIQHIVAGCKIQAGNAYIWKHNLVTVIGYRNICAAYGLEVPKSRCEIPPKVVENNRAEVLWEFQFHTDKQPTNQT